MSVFEHITEWCTHVIELSGYPGVFFLMALESMIAPIPSEAVMPFAGFLAYDGKMSMVWIGLWSTLGSISGSMVSYWLGIYGGRPLVLKVGRYLLLNVHHLDATERFFNRFGNVTVFICRFIPVVRHFISIPAGMGRMPIWHFIIMTTVGAACWNMFLAWAGWYLNANWEDLREYFHIIDIVILVAILLVVAAFIARQIIEWRAQRRARMAEDK
jgi:membrane protein DedA with SNARE-associated domain